MAQPARIEKLDIASRIDDAWAEVRRLRALRQEIDQNLQAAELALDAERGRSNSKREPLMTVPAAATRLGVSESKLWKAIRAGTLAATRLGRNTRISEADLARYVGILS